MTAFREERTYRNVKNWLTRAFNNKLVQYVTIAFDKGFVEIDLYREDKIMVLGNFSRPPTIIDISSKVTKTQLHIDYRFVDWIVLRYNPHLKGKNIGNHWFDEVIFNDVAKPP
ncbi:MAG: hypothetical protein QXU98_04995 [Candidatus Parvarchaeota archaeon]